MDDFQKFLETSLIKQQSSIQAYDLGSHKSMVKRKHLNVMVCGFMPSKMVSEDI